MWFQGTHQFIHTFLSFSYIILLSYIALLDARRQYIFNGQWRVSLGKRRYNTYGTAVYYSGPNEVEENIIVPGIMKTSLEIRVKYKVACLLSDLLYTQK